MPRQTGILREFVTRPREIGALAASSPTLGRAVAAHVRWAPESAVVEAGPGSGAITEFLVEGKPKDAAFLAVELNPTLAAALARRLPEVAVVEGDLSDLPAICASRGVSRVGTVVATLPWSLLPEERQRALLDSIVDVLDPGGSLVFYIYLHALPLWRRSLFARLLRERFETVEEAGAVWRNVPPALVFACKNPVVSPAA